MRRRWIAACACTLVAAGAGAVAYELTSGGAKTLTGPGDAFTLSYPSSWSVVPQATLSRLPDHPEAVLRSVGVGSVTISRGMRADLDASVLRLQVAADFSERLEDYRLLSAGGLETRAGAIFVYSYLAPDARDIHTVALVPAGNHTFQLDSVAAPGAGKQVETMIRSFRPR